jgi:hypothetical protein
MTKDKHRSYNGQKRQMTNTGNKMDKKDKGQTQAIQYTKKKKDKNRPYNRQKRQWTNTGHTIYKKDKGQTQATK